MGWCWLLVFVVIYAQAQTISDWAQCSILKRPPRQLYGFVWPMEKMLPLDALTQCTNVTMTDTIFSVKRYRAQNTRKGTVIIVGDSIPVRTSFQSNKQGTSGNSIEWVGIKLYNTLGRSYDVVLPDFRGTDNVTCDFSYDNLCIDSTKPNSNTYTVDAVANDLLFLTTNLKVANETIFVMGRGFGSYIVHRMMQINDSSIDAVIMDGVCAGIYCNPSDWDNQRDTMARNILSQAAIMKNSSTYFFMEGMDPLGTYQKVLENTAQGYTFCGLYRFAFDEIKYPLINALFDQSTRPMFFNIIRDTITSYSCLPIYPELKYFSINMTKPATDTYVGTSLLLSEFQFTSSSQSLPFSLETNKNAQKLLSNGWSSGPVSPYKSSIASFKKPMLMLNGDYDPRAPLENAKLFASMFNSTGQSLIFMPGMSSNSFVKSYVRSPNSTTCGANLISQFVGCPTCVLNTTCVQDMVGFTIDGDEITDLLPYLWYKFPLDIPKANYYMACAVIMTLVSIAALIFFILLIVFTTNRRVKARLLAPHIGLLFVVSRAPVNVPFYVFSYKYYSDYTTTYVPVDQLIGTNVGNLISCVLLSLATSCMLMHIIRFLGLTFVYKAMSDNSSSKFFKVLVSKPIFFTVTIIVGVVWTIISVIMVSVDPPNYRGLGSGTVYGSAAYNGAVCVMAVFLVIVDMIIHTIQSCSPYDYFIKSDPLYFRFESIMLIPLVILGILGNSPINGAEAIFIVFCACCVVFFGGILVGACVLDKIRNAKSYTRLQDETDEKPVTDEEILHALLENKVGLKIIMEYCLKEFSLENIFGYLDVREIVKNMDDMADEKFKETIQKFHNMYIKRGSVREINVPAGAANQFGALVRGDDVDAKKVMTSLTGAIGANLMDTFSRFKNTREYIAYQNSANLKADIENALELNSPQAITTQNVAV